MFVKLFKALPVVLLIAFANTGYVAAQNASKEEEQKVDAYIQKQKKSGAKPKANVPAWEAGYTCSDLKKSHWDQYLECRYYYSENGRYYPG